MKKVTTEEKKDKKTGKVKTVERVEWRYTISERARQEVLKRLLKLNHEIYAQEVAAGVHKKKKGKKARPDASGDGVSGVKDSDAKRKAGKKKDAGTMELFLSRTK